MPTPVLLVCALTAWADPPADAPLAPPPVVAALESSLSDVIARVEPSVVAIAREKSESGKTTAVRGRNPEPSTSDPRVVRPTPLGERGGELVSFDFGSGVVIGAKGEILTAFHVVRGARRLVVRAVEHQSFEAEVIAADPRSDLAVIVPRDIPDVASPKLRAISLGDAAGLRKGSFLVALGNSFNAAAQDGRPSAGWGILANVARKFDRDPPEEEQPRPLRYHPTLLQLDAKLNVGMGGGAVVNMKGELVGVTTAAASVGGYDAQAGYAIPLDAIGRRAVESLREGKEVEYGFLGINLDEHGTSLVRSARPGTPAAEGGIQAGDVVVAVNGRPVNNSDALLLAINALPAGVSAKLKVNRNGELLEKTVELAKYPMPTSEVISTNVPPAWRGLRVDYMSKHPNAAGPFGEGILNAMSLGGVVVVDVEPDSPAEKAGVKRGQVITQVGTTRVRNPREFAQVAAGIKGPVMLHTDLGEVTVP